MGFIVQSKLVTYIGTTTMVRLTMKTLWQVPMYIDYFNIIPTNSCYLSNLLPTLSLRRPQQLQTVYMLQSVDWYVCHFLRIPNPHLITDDKHIVPNCSLSSIEDWPHVWYCFSIIYHGCVMMIVCVFQSVGDLCDPHRTTQTLPIPFQDHFIPLWFIMGW